MSRYGSRQARGDLGRSRRSFNLAMRFPELTLRTLPAFALAFFSGAHLISAQEQSATVISREVKEVFERSSKAVVKIHGVDEHSDIYGTGFFIDPTGTIYTCYSVGGEAENFTVQFGGKDYPARQMVADVRSGVAILKIDAITPSLPVSATDPM